MDVSKSLRGVGIPTGATVPRLGPASTCHEATLVAPFQLAYTVVVAPVVCASRSGAVNGCPLQTLR